jgi:hypothetical protein
LVDPVLEQIGIALRTLAEQRDGIVRVVVLGQHHHPGPRVALADLFGGVDAFPLERRRHADVSHDHLGGGRLGPPDQLVVVGGRPDHLEIGFESEQRPHALPHQQVVVG